MRPSQTLALLAPLLLTTACPRRAPVKRPPPLLAGARLTGVWLGTVRDRPAPGVHREVRVLYQLQAHLTTGKVTGSLAFRGALTSAYQGRLQCNRQGRVELKRAATIAHGRFDARQARWTLDEVKEDGAGPCAFRFPMAKQCAATPRHDGGLAVRCGALAVTLRPVQVTGVWAWDDERTDRAGDTLIQHQRFHLVQRGEVITGFADDLRVFVSQDGQRYRCNGRLRYVQQARHQLTGRLTGLTVTLRRVSTLRRSGPCAGDAVLPAELVGTWKPFEGRLELPLTERGRKLRRLPGLRPVGAPPLPGAGSAPQEHVP